MAHHDDGCDSGNVTSPIRDDVDVFEREHIAQCAMLRYDDDYHHVFAQANGFFVQATLDGIDHLFFVSNAHFLAYGRNAHRVRSVMLKLSWPHSRDFSTLNLPLDRWVPGHDEAVLMPEWTYDRHSDVAIVPVPEILTKQLLVKTLKQVAPFEENSHSLMPGQRRITASDSITVQGFPVTFPHHVLPFKCRSPQWKQMPIAYPPDEDFDGLPVILMNAPCMPSLSGSPVFTTSPSDPDCLQPVGVYSGEEHFGHQHLTGPHVSNVWKWSALVSVLSVHFCREIKATDVKLVCVLPEF